MLEGDEAGAPDSKRVYDLMLMLMARRSLAFGIYFDSISMDDRNAKRHGSVHYKRGILDVCAAQARATRPRKSGSIVVLGIQKRVREDAMM